MRWGKGDMEPSLAVRLLAPWTELLWAPSLWAGPLWAAPLWAASLWAAGSSAVMASLVPQLAQGQPLRLRHKGDRSMGLQDFQEAVSCYHIL